MNISRKMDLNQYDLNRPVSQAQAIRKHGMEYQKKLQKKFDCERLKRYKPQSKMPEINYEREINFWYGERIEGLQNFYHEYMKKMQK